ncbi:MAG TPA: hypothetical protein VFK85_16955 [Anaeromyxobacteraceae bacterium]|nr:hypothetical protein [Anaeromyxobacteraceae bacterium]
MHDPRDENDVVKDAWRAANTPPEKRQPPSTDGLEDGKDVTPRAVAKEEQRELREAEREADSGSLGSGIGDDRPGRAAPHDGDPD